MIYSPCIDAIYFGREDVSIEERIRSVKKAGYTHYEFWTWWDKDIELIKKLNDELSLEIGAMCTKFISLVDETKRDEYIEGLKDSIQAAKRLGVKTLISQTGNEMGIDRELQRTSLVEGLKACVPLLEQSGITLVVEPLNLLVDHEGYFLSRSDEAEELIRKVNSKYVKILFDVYHQQITEGHLAVNIGRMIDIIGHFHFADNPGRKELGTGEINYKYIINSIRELGYKKCIGLEFFPDGNEFEKMRDVLIDYNLSEA